MALYATCMPLPSDTFHDKLFACDRGDDADNDHDHEEGLWLSMQPVCLCRRTPFMISSLHVTKVIILIMIMTARRYCGSYSRRSSACDSANNAILGSDNV